MASVQLFGLVSLAPVSLLNLRERETKKPRARGGRREVISREDRMKDLSQSPACNCLPAWPACSLLHIQPFDAIHSFSRCYVSSSCL